MFIGARNVSLIVLARTVRSGLGTGSMLRKSDVTSVRVADCITGKFLYFFPPSAGFAVSQVFRFGCVVFGSAGRSVAVHTIT